MKKIFSLLLAFGVLGSFQQSVFCPAPQIPMGILFKGFDVPGITDEDKAFIKELMNLERSVNKLISLIDYSHRGDYRFYNLMINADNQQIPDVYINDSSFDHCDFVNEPYSNIYKNSLKKMKILINNSLDFLKQNPKELEKRNEIIDCLYDILKYKTSLKDLEKKSIEARESSESITTAYFIEMKKITKIIKLITLSVSTNELLSKIFGIEPVTSREISFVDFKNKMNQYFDS